MAQTKSESKVEYNARQAAYMRDRYRKNTEWMREYKVAMGCMDCGFNAHHAGLEFDHRDGRSTEDKQVARIMGGALARIQEEIAKCDVVCGTCHNIRTWTRQQETIKRL